MGFFDKIQDTISSAADQTKAKAQEAQLKRERKQKLEALGEQVFNLYTSGRLAQEELAAACSEISELDGRIASIEQQAVEAQNARAQAQQSAAPPSPGVAPPPAAPANAGTTCPSCGAEVAGGGRFCPVCGCEVGAGAPEQTGAGTQPPPAGPEACAPPPPGGAVKPPPPPPPGVEPKK